jgi:hypothetical protein
MFCQGSSLLSLHAPTPLPSSTYGASRLTIDTLHTGCSLQFGHPYEAKFSGGEHGKWGPWSDNSYSTIGSMEKSEKMPVA